MRLLIRGGSIAAGVGAAAGYADLLARHYAPRGVEVINRSRRGETSFDGVLSFYEDIDPFRPALLLIHFGVDDAFSPVYRSEFKENLVYLVRLARRRFDPAVCLATSHPFANLGEMEAMEIYYRTIREVAVDLGCEMVSVHTYWAGVVVDRGISHTDLLQRDARLPNDGGHAVIAEAMLRRLDGILAGPGSAAGRAVISTQEGP